MENKEIIKKMKTQIQFKTRLLHYRYAGISDRLVIH